MFPEEFSGRIRAVGNSALKGAALLLDQPEKWKKPEGQPGWPRRFLSAMTGLSGGLYGQYVFLIFKQ